MVGKKSFQWLEDLPMVGKTRFFLYLSFLKKMQDKGCMGVGCLLVCALMLSKKEGKGYADD